MTSLEAKPELNPPKPRTRVEQLKHAANRLADFALWAFVRPGYGSIEPLPEYLITQDASREGAVRREAAARAKNNAALFEVQRPASSFTPEGVIAPPTQPQQAPVAMTHEAPTLHAPARQ